MGYNLINHIQLKVTHTLRAIFAALVLLIIVLRFLSADVLPIWIYIGGSPILTEVMPILALALLTLMSVAASDKGDRQTPTTGFVRASIALTVAALCLYSLLVSQGGVFWVAIPIDLLGIILSAVTLGGYCSILLINH